jgi:hypothetical protein
MSKIKLPQLADDQVREIQAMHTAGESVNAISIKTKIRYSAVWFYAVNEGRPVPSTWIESCWCGAEHYGHGLCRKHWAQQRRQQRRAA